jgi:hypothetical protein
MAPNMPRFRMRVLAIRRERLALQNSLHKLSMRLENLLTRMEALESAATGQAQSRHARKAEGQPATEDFGAEYEVSAQEAAAGAVHPGAATHPRRSSRRTPAKRGAKETKASSGG